MIEKITRYRNPMISLKGEFNTEKEAVDASIEAVRSTLEFELLMLLSNDFGGKYKGHVPQSFITDLVGEITKDLDSIDEFLKIFAPVRPVLHGKGWRPESKEAKE